MLCMGGASRCTVVELASNKYRRSSRSYLKIFGKQCSSCSIEAGMNVITNAIYSRGNISDRGQVVSKRYMLVTE